MPTAATSHTARQRPEQLAFNVPNIAAMSSTVITSKAGLSQSEKRAAARAILRHNLHIDNDTSTRDDGLNCWYMDLHGKGDADDIDLAEIKAITNETFRDVLDAVSVLDAVDGGISLVLHCPGYQPKATIAPENITVDVYVSPRELAEGGKKFSELVALIVQDFGTNLVIPHLRRFQNRCRKEGVKPLGVRASGKPISIEGPSHLPHESTAGSGHIRCRCRPEDRAALAKAIAIHQLGPSPSFSMSSIISPDSAAVAVNNNNLSGQTNYTGSSDVSCDINDPFGGALISLGPHTDAMIERFRFDDSVVRRLRILTQTVRSSRWEEVLCTDPKWGLTFAQAVKISEALCLDITASRNAFARQGSSARSWVFSLVMIIFALLFYFFV